MRNSYKVRLTAYSTYLALSLVALFAVTAAVAVAQDYPRRPLQFVVPYPAGGSSDVQARIIAQGLSDRIGQPVIVENRPGASAVIGTRFVASQPADGHTLLFAAPPFLIAPHTQANVLYDPQKDFVGVSVLTRAPMVIAVPTKSPVKTFAELVAKAKAEPGKISYGSVGAGGHGHLATELMMRRLGLQLAHIPYKGSAPALTDLAGGQIDMMLTTPLDLASQLNSGFIRVIASGTPQRSSFLPDVPTIEEAGFAGIELGYWFGAIVVRTGTPSEIVQRLSSEIRHIMQQPDVRAKLAAQSVELIGSNSTEYADFIRAENARITEAVSIVGVKAQ